jgi:DNA-binding transcriptional LysR family regulator
MNWDDLRYFLAVARIGSVSGAARQLGVQHSTVSRRLRRFERKIGSRLLERRQGRYELTSSGERVMEAAGRIEREVLGVDNAVLGRDTLLIGPLRVAALNNMASTVLMPMFATFQRAHPRVELHIIVANVDASLPQREADVAIRLTNTPSETLIGKRVATVKSTVYGQRDYLARVRKSGGEPTWLGVECCDFHRTWTRQLAGEPRHDFYSDDTQLTVAALKQGLGVSIIPCFMGDAEPDLERWREPDPSHDLGLWVLLHPDLKRTARVLAFRDHMVAAIAERVGVFEGRLVKA